MIGLKLKDIISKNNIYLDEKATLKQAIDIMESNGKGVIVIVKDNNMPVGILTERDIVEIVCNGVDLNSPVIRYAKKNLITTQCTKTIGYALNLMVSNNIRRIVVTDESGTLIGIITLQDIIKHLEDDFYRSTLKIRHIIEKNQKLIYVNQDDLLNTAMRLMIENKVSAIPIIEKGRAVGIITEKDILRIAKNCVLSNDPVSKFMSKPVITIKLDDPITYAVEIMNKKNIRKVVVVNSEGIAVSMVTQRDLLQNLESDYTKFIERKLKHTKDILNFLPEMIMEIIDDGKQIIIWANERTLDRFGTNIINSPVTDFIPADKWSMIYNTLSKFGRAENIKFKKDDNIYEISGFFINTEEVLYTGKMHLIIRDITDEVKLYITDPLTGLYNRRFLNEILHKELELSKRYNRQLSLAIADVDNFKKINDTYGHIAGDTVLKAIAETVLKNIRESDIASRYGGEEFVIIMSQTDKADAVKAIERLREAISKEKILLNNKNSISVTISVGIASYPDDAEYPGDLLISADDRLYKAKREGKNRSIWS